MFDEDEAGGVEGAGPLEEDEAFYPDSSQWEAEEEDEARLPPSAAITEKVREVCCCSFTGPVGHVGPMSPPDCCR